MTYAYKNGTEDYVVIETVQDNGEKRCVLAPDKLKHVFGSFEKALQYLAWEGDEQDNDTSRMLIATEEVEAAKGRQEREILRLSTVEWKQLRATVLGDETIRRQLALYKQYLIDSGLAVRCVEEDAFGYYYGLFEDYLRDRLAYMDEFFEYSGGTVS